VQKGAEVQSGEWCREMQRCSIGVEMWSCRWRGAEVQRCRGVELQRCSGAVVDNENFKVHLMGL